MEKINENQFVEKINDEGEKCLVLFSRKSCHVCQEVHPMIEEIEEDYKDKDFGFYHVDIEEQKDLFSKFTLKGVPQVLFFDNGDCIYKVGGKQEEDVYTDKIDAILGE